MEEGNRCAVVHVGLVDECHRQAARCFDPVDPELDPAATHAPRPQPEPGETVVVMELDELWHFLKKREQAVDLAGF